MTDVIESPPSEAFETAKLAQSAAANPTRSAWVEANAGSGKTRVLIDRVARLLLRGPDGRPGAKPDSILCITYTKAAANEMLSRLYSRLGGWAVSSDESLRKTLSRLEGRNPDAYQPEDFREARRLFARALETPGGLRIETIHAFCTRLLRQFPLEAGVSPGFVALEDNEADELWQSALISSLQSAAVTHTGAIAVLAKATGGRGVVAALDALKFKRTELLAFKQTLSSEMELINHVNKASGADNREPQAILTAAMTAQLPTSSLVDAIELLAAMDAGGKSDEKLLAGLRSVLETTDPAERFERYMNAIAGSDWSFPNKSNPYTKNADAIVVDLFSRDQRKGIPEGREISRLKDVYEAYKAALLAQRTLALMQIGLPVVSSYTEAKKQRGALDFDDLITRAHALLTGSSSAEWVLFKLDGGLTHLLLDEAQDTSPTQWALINALIDEFQSGAGQDRTPAPRTLFVVGDPKQSIYSFQGANQEKFKAERQRFVRREEPAAIAQDREVNLPEMAMSFRSTPEVLRFVDEVRDRVPLADATTSELPPRAADIQPHTARRSNQPGRVELWPLEMPNDGDAEDTAWTAPVDHTPANAPRRRLAERVARQVREMLDRGEGVWREDENGKWSLTPVEPQDILILVRSRNELFDALIESLKQRKVPVAGADRLRLQDNLGVQDCLNLLRFALQPGDDLVLAEILRGPFCGLIDDNNHLFPLAHNRGPGVSLWSRLLQSEAPEFSAAKSFCESLIERRRLPAFDFLLGVLTKRDPKSGLSGWDRLIQRMGEPARDPVQALLSGALSHDMTQAKSLQTFLSTFEARDTVLKRELGEPDGAVRVMTVHGAKGLQAPIVILPDTTGETKQVTDALFFSADGTPLYSPSKSTDAKATSDLREIANTAAEKESRRLLYVALTRAADRLIIAGAGTNKPKDGYSKSSWYRWCILAMHGLNGLDGDAERSEDVQSIGPDPVLFGEQQREDLSPGKPPGWLLEPAAKPAPPVRLAAPSRLAAESDSVLRPFGPDRKSALLRGRLIHGLLQILPETPPQQQDAVANQFLSRTPDLTEAERSEMIGVTLKTLRNRAFASVFGPGGRSEAAIVGTLHDGRMVNGRVDRLIISAEDIQIIDYKTDRPAPDDAEGVETAYLVQMAAYRLVLSNIYPDRPIRCALLYTDGPKLIELNGELLSESLNRVESRV